jgi:long-chain acyl-CoA synthetase
VRQFSTPPVATISEASNLTDPVWDNAERFPHSPQFAVQEGGGWRDISCAEFREHVVAVAKGLIAAGIQPGERVALMSRTRYEWTLTDYAIWAAGAVTVPIYETSSPEQLQWILADSQAAAVVVETDAHLQHVLAVRDSAPDLRHLWQIAPSDASPGAIAELTEQGAQALERGQIAQDAVDRRRRGVRADDLATMIYTSGTTGRPKGCMITHRNIATDIGNALPGLTAILTPGASTVLFLPLAHSFARLIQAGVVATRVRTAFTSDTRNLVALLQDFRPNFVLAVPRVFEKVYNTAKQTAYAGGKGAIFDRAERTAIAYSEALSTPSGPGLMLRARHALFDRLVYGRLRAALGGQCHSAISGGAPLGARLAHFFRGIGVTVYEGYGLTETSPAAAVNLQQSIRIGTAGGKNVAPAVLEDRVRAHRLVSQCMVVGDRQPFVAALVTLDEEALPAWLAEHHKPAGTPVADLCSDADLRAEIQQAVDEANKAVSTAESIRVFRILPGDFTEANGLLTPSLKVKRGEVAKAYAHEIAAIYG